MKTDTTPAQKTAGHHADDGHAHEHAHGSNSYAEVLLAALAGLLLLAGWLVERSVGEGARAAWMLYVGAYAAGGFFAVREAWENLRARKLQIDALMLVAAAGAAALGQWAEGALLLFLFSLGHALESYAMGRARRAIEALGELRPETALVRRGTTLVELAVDAIEIGDVVVVKPDERVAVDGFVILGATSIDQSAITGESVPVDKLAVASREEARRRGDALPAEHRVFAGTINRERAIEVETTRRSDQSTLARVVELVRSAQAQKSPTQLFTDRFQRYFVPAVLALAVLLMFAWVVIDEPFSASFYRAMAVLVAASPCALAISTPSAVLSGVARAARGGVLIKGGGPLERLGVLHALAFDKTGTLTEGKPRVTDVAPAEGVSEIELLRVAVAVERLSDHPLAAAVVRDGAQRLSETPIPVASDLQSLTGRGLQANVEGKTVHLGKKMLFSEIEGPGIPVSLAGRIEALENQGRTVFALRHGDRYLGAIGLMDTPREAARHAIERLRALGMSTMVMLSGDNQRVADAIAASVGLERAVGDLMPEDKVAEIKKLRAVGEVAMVGDGVNDAPALAAASVGIAMGAAGSDVALETADVALMADRLEHLPFVIGLSRQSRRIIRQNLWASLGMVAFLIPATMFGMQMGVAVLFHEGSTLLVVANALRLLAFRDRKAA
ncbi:heavy metal translocating P-type ATPase [Tahibacter sp.]|uniref:heavy metal translocating P-type ATPase n=1 Tax=Tahibacter sp. TaxID=2056211 RepID=UPI0028C4FCD6|nr:heavy metal translocating P-type ATPase [Tahibacter sp.]